MKNLLTKSSTLGQWLCLMALLFLGKTSAAQCTANFSYQIVSGKTVSFTNTSTGTNLISKWQFNGPSGFSNQTSPTYTFPNPGWQRVCLTISSSTDSLCSSVRCDSIFIPGSSVCEAIFAVTYQPNAPTPQQVWYNALASKGTNLVYVWEHGDGSPMDTTYMGAGGHVFTQPGTYTICLKVYDILNPNNCQDTSCQRISFTQKVACTADYQYFSDSTQHPSLLHFVPSYNMPNTAYLWDFGDGQSSTQMKPTHSYAQPGYYRVCLTISNTVDSCSATSCDTVEASMAMSLGKLGMPGNLGLQVWPNPSDGSFYLEGLDQLKEEVVLQVYSIEGKEMAKRIIRPEEGNTQLIATEAIAPGLYYLHLHHAQSTQIIKLLKK